MDGSLTMVIILMLFTVLLFVGMHIGTILIVSGVVGLFLLDGFRSFPAILQDATFYSIASYTLTTIPLFIIMAQFIVRSDIIGLLYKLIFDLSKQSGGMLGGFTLLLGGFLGALSGSPTAISAALGEISLPELRKHGFNKYLAGATVATAGSMSTIIPPSIILIVYGATTQTSIGQLFMAMIIPAIITLALLFISVFILYAFVSKREGLNKEVENVTKEVAAPNIKPSLKNYVISIGSLVIIIGAVFGGIFSGIFTPTEAGAAGAFFSLIMALLLKKVNLKFFKKSIDGTVKITCMVLFIILGASIFGKFMTLSLVPTKIIGWIEPLLAYPTLLIIALLLIYFVLFMFIEGTAVIIMTASIAVPIAAEAGYSPLVFGILLTVVCAAGLLTPPVGLSVYSVAGVSNLAVHKLFIYATVYALIITFGVIPLLLIFPEIVTWLPSLM